MIKEAVVSTKTVLISGAAGGLGKALVRKFADIGYRVIATDINSEGLSRFNGWRNVTARVIDVTNYDHVRELEKDFNLGKRGLDVLVCLAGIYSTFPVTEAQPGLLKKIMEVNFSGTVSLVQAFLGHLTENKGRVIVVSSESYKIQAMFQPYMISKAALEAFCRVARQELALKGVKLSVIRPGAINTPLLKWMDQPVDARNYPVFSSEFIKSWKQSLKMVGKISSPESVAAKIILAATAKKPKRVYRINNSILLHIISLIPEGLFDKLTVDYFRSDK
jgi:NAD(P)-dependent dehydrogenase (short-subunit alcohol dehydrogenase family)